MFAACSTKTNQPSQLSLSENTYDDSFDDNFDEEFEEEESHDLLEDYNRAITSFNDAFFIHIFNPTSEVTSEILNKDIRIGISNVFKNLSFPVRFVNNILQLKFLNAFDEMQRFIINSTLGVVGIFDVAKKTFNIEAHNEDFGQTLGFYGVQGGPHIVLPFFGPSNLRDSFSIFADSYLSPFVSTEEGGRKYAISNNLLESFAYTSVYYINKNSLELGQYQALKKDSIDLYILLKSYYEEKRIQEIKE